jgi:Tfp pilus assembly protein PilX
MSKMKKTQPMHQRGYLVMLLAIMIVIVGFIATTATSLFYGGAFSTSAHLQSDEALYLAEAGLEHATHQLLEATVTSRVACANLGTTPINNSLGNGEYSVTSSGSTLYAGGATVASTLTSAIASNSTSIPVSSTTPYAPVGRIMIDKERINYGGVTATSFTNLTRGVDSTVAVAHASGTTVGQYLCNLTSQGGVPSLASAQGMRVLQNYIQLQEAFAVGDSSGGNFTIGVFNYPTELSWYNSKFGGGVTLYGISMLSYTDGWLVGANFLEHWNGNSTSTFTTPVNVSYRSVYCNSANDCHAVGDNTGNSSVNPTIIRWTGTGAWTRLTPTSNGVGSGLKSVHCGSTADCWAVGDIGTGSSTQGYRFYHWAGASWIGITISPAAVTAAFPFNGVFCNSATDCWAVGATNNFGRLTSGTNWVAVATGLPNVKYSSIYCNSASDCWAVGTVSATNLFVHWNGAAWSRDASAPTPLTNLTSVACTDTNDCWAVGSSNAGNNPQFFHWNGVSWTNYVNVANGAFASATLRSVAVVGGHSAQPMSAWSESFS